ncbi:MAG: hypothetical protein LBP87_15450, partial [Planctomycetaceae bacterium]|nr:hypothetical protein [Planctomycetaceae bacterium]
MANEPIDVVNQNVDVADQTVEKKPEMKRKRYFLRAMKILGGVLLVWMIWSFQSVPLRISPETTFITEPRTANGKWIDYFAAYEQKYYPPEMKTDDNGYRLIAKNLGMLKYDNSYLDSETLQHQAYEKIGLDPNNKPTLFYQSPHTFLADYTEKQFPNDENNDQKTYELDRKITTIWTLDDLPMMKEWLEKNNAALDMIVEAVSKPVFHIPLIRLENVENPTQNMVLSLISIEQTQRTRDFARALQARFNYRLGTGEIDGAIQDKIAIPRLGRHVAT